MLVAWRDSSGRFRKDLWVWGFVVAAIIVMTLLVRPPAVRASEGPTAELRDVVSALRDLNATLKEVAQNLEGVERALKEGRR